MNKKNPATPANSIFDRLKLIKVCPLCSAEYTDTEVRVLEEGGGSHLVHITCPKCKSAMLTLIVVSKFGVGTMGTVTDLNAADVKRIRSLEPIQQDEVLEYYEVLKSNGWYKNLNQ